MRTFVQFVLILSALTAIRSEPEPEPDPNDDGKYNPRKYNFGDDGKYYRPLQEGKYVPTDEGKYTYIYRQDPDQIFRYIHREGPNGGADDGDYRYIHQIGPNGSFGGNGGFGGFGGNGGFGPNGPNGPDGPKGPAGPKGPGGPNRVDSFSGKNSYASRYPYIHKVINSLVNKYVSSDYLASEGSSNHYSKLYADNEIALKCHYLSPSGTPTQSEIVTQYPPRMKVQPGEKSGSYYSFKGTKTLNTVANSLNTKLKLDYEVFVRVTEVVD